MEKSSAAPGRALTDAVDDFLVYLRFLSGLSMNTVTHYGHDLSLFLRYLADRSGASLQALSLEDVTPAHIEGFLRYLTEERGNSDRSVKRRLAAVRSFFTYAMQQQPNGRNGSMTNPALAVSAPSVYEPPPLTITGEEAVRLLRATRAHGPNPVRDYAIMRLFLHCAARLSEVLALELDDIDLVHDLVRLGAATDRDRLVPLSEETRRALCAYLVARPAVPAAMVFISRRGRPITKGAIYHLVDKCIGAAALNGLRISIHTLRHTCLVMLAREGFTVTELQKLAGLRRRQTAAIYIRLAAELAAQEEQPDEQA